MFKKTAHIILALLVFISTTGMTVSKHYCGDKLESIAIDSTTDSCCEMPDCCHDETSFYKVNDDFSVPALDNQIQVSSIDLLFTTTFLAIAFEIIAPDYVIFSLAESPPPLETDSVLALIQSYLC